MKILILFLVFSLFLSSNAMASLMIGTGMSSVTKGRTVPNLYSGFDADSFVISGYAVGVKTEVYYHSAYRVSYYEQISLGSNKKVGYGLGLHYSVRGFKNGKNAQEEKESDVGVGPGFRFAYEFGESFFASLETMYGINGLMLVALSFQNVNSLNIGMRF